jgi:hypothetical protein
MNIQLESYLNFQSLLKYNENMNIHSYLLFFIWNKFLKIITSVSYIMEVPFIAFSSFASFFFNLSIIVISILLQTAHQIKGTDNSRAKNCWWIGATHCGLDSKYLTFILMVKVRAVYWVCMFANASLALHNTFVLFHKKNFSITYRIVSPERF